MLDSEKITLINSYLAFVCGASICGFIFYGLANTENYYQYKFLVDGFGLIFWITGLITIFLLFKFGGILKQTYKDKYDVERELGLKNENYIGLLLISLVSVFLFNPFISIPERFEDSRTIDGSNQGYMLMAFLLLLNIVLSYYSRQQIKKI